MPVAARLLLWFARKYGAKIAVAALAALGISITIDALDAVGDAAGDRVRGQIEEALQAQQSGDVAQPPEDLAADLAEVIPHHTPTPAAVSRQLPLDLPPLDVYTEALIEEQQIDRLLECPYATACQAEPARSCSCRCRE